VANLNGQLDGMRLEVSESKGRVQRMHEKHALERAETKLKGEAMRRRLYCC
jgi:hypothetical protein